ncbi:hypothetical protein GGF32_008855 [Allomyces javanicus]|nr:hypothetical protein GGF32_008855 [Allomyces javanicus]
MHAAIPPTLARAGTAHAAPTASAVGKPPTLIASTSSFSVLDTTWSAAGATFGPLVVPPNLRRGDSDFGLVSGWTDAPTPGASIARPASLLHVPNRTATATPLARGTAPGSPGASVLDALFALRLPPAPPATPVPVQQQQQQQQQQPTNKWLSALVPPALERHYSAPPATIPAAAAAAAPAPDDDEKAGLATLAALDLLATAADTAPPAPAPRTQQAATMTNAYRTPPTRTLYMPGNDAFHGSAPGTPVAPVPARPIVTAADTQRFAASVGVASPSASYTPAPEWRHVQAAGAPVTPATPMQIAQPNPSTGANVAAYAAPALGPGDASGMPYTASTTWGGPYASGYSLGSPAKDNAAVSVASPPPAAMPAAAGFNQYRPPAADAYAPPPPPPIPQQATTTTAQYQQAGQYATSAPQQAEPFGAQYQQYQHQAPTGGNTSEFTVPGTAAAGHHQFQVPAAGAGMVEYGAQTVSAPPVGAPSVGAPSVGAPSVGAPSIGYNQYQVQHGPNTGEYASPPSTTTIADYNQYQSPQGGISSDYTTAATTGFNQYQTQQGAAITSNYSHPPTSATTSYNQYQPAQGTSTTNDYSVAPTTTTATGYNQYQSPPSSTVINDFSAPTTTTTAGFNQYQSPPASSAYNQYQAPPSASATGYNQYQSPPSSSTSTAAIPATNYSTTTAAPYYSTTTTAGYYPDAPPPQTYIPGLPPGVVSAGPTSTLGSPQLNVYSFPPPPPHMDYGPRCTQCGVYVDAPGPTCAHPPTCQVCLFASPTPCTNCTSVGLLEPVKYPVVKMSNIPWDVTQRDIQDYFSPTQIPSIGGLPLVHVLMVRESGKTKSDAFVELPTISHLGEALHERQRRILRGRIVTLTPSSQEELMRAVFPAFPGSWNGVDAVPAAAEGQAPGHGAPAATVATAGPGTHGTPAAVVAANAYRGPLAAAVASDPAMSSSWASWSDASSLGSWTAGETSAGSAADTLATSPPSTTSTAAATTADPAQHHAHLQPHQPVQQHAAHHEAQPAQHQQPHHAQQQQYPPCFLTRNEINQILAVCKNYKLFFSRKCAQRPFENVVTILLKFPWHQRALVSTLQRDHMFEMAKLCIESLHQHLIKPYHQIDPSLMDRLLRAVLMVPAFTEKQKTIVLDASGHACPSAFTHLLTLSGHTPAGGPPGSLADVGHGARDRAAVAADETEARHVATTELAAAAVGAAHEHEHDDDASYLASESPPADHLHDEHEHDDPPTPTTKTLTPALAPAPAAPTVNHHQQWASILRNANAAPAASHEHGAADIELRAALARAHGTIARLEGTVLAYELRVKQLERELAAERAQHQHHGLAVAAEDHARQVARDPAVQHGVGSPTLLVAVVAERGGVGAGGEVRPSGVAV